MLGIGRNENGGPGAVSAPSLWFGGAAAAPSVGAFLRLALFAVFLYREATPT
jgi:hypothetical protein